VFDLVGHSRDELDTTYRIIHVSHVGSQPQVLDQDAKGEFDYANRFTVTEKIQPFRAPQQTHKPRSCAGCRPRRWSGPTARRSTPTSTAA
jgi:uncharacterized protein involved in type VI secretion and phage assembly